MSGLIINHIINRRGYNQLKRKLCLLLSVIFVVVSLFSACSKNQQTEKSSSTKATTGASSAQPTETPKKDVTIKYSYMWPVPDDMQKIVDSFMKENPNIKVEPENIAVGQYYDVIKTRMAAGDFPDVYAGWPGSSMVPFMDSGYCADLSSEAWVGNITDGTKRDVSYKGKVMMFPTSVSIMAVGYNKKIFDDLSVKVPDTYAEFLDICEKAKAKGIMPIATGSKDNSGYIFPAWLMAVTDIYSKNPDFDSQVSDGKDSLNDPAWNKIFERFMDWYKKGYIPANQLGVDRATVSLNDFVSGKAAMYFMGSWDYPTIRKAAGADFQLGLFPFPGENTGAGAVLMATDTGLAVNDKSEAKPEAIQFLDYFAKPEINTQFNMAVKNYSSLEGVSVDIDPSANDLVPYITKNPTWGFINNGWPDGVFDALSKNMQEVIAGKKKVSDALEAANKTWVEKVKK